MNICRSDEHPARRYWHRCPVGGTGGSAVVLAALLAASSVQAQISTLTRTSSFEYDASGLLIKEVVEPDRPQDCLSTSYGHDAFGNRISVSTQACVGAVGDTISSATSPRASGTTYGAQSVVIGGVTYATPAGVFATSSTNALNQTETRQYDPRFGSVVKLTGPNNGITTWSYDGFGRKLEEKRADGTSTRWEYKFCGQAQADGSAAPCVTSGSVGPHATVWYASEASYASNGLLLGPKKLQIHDALDRVVRIQFLDFHGQIVVQDSHFNNLGQLLQKSNIYRLTGGTPAWTIYSYDELGRIKQEDAPVPEGVGGRAITSFTYNGLITTVINPAGQTKTTHKNATGQTAKVVDHLGNQVVYTYDALGQLTQTAAAGSITKMGYSQRGHKLWMEDPAMGRWDYAHNAFGELVRQTDSLGQVTTMAYDVLGRLTQRTEPDLVSTWAYDKKFDLTNCGAGIGKLCEARTTAGYQRVHTYDAIGRPTTTATKLDSATTLASMSQAYDPVTGRVSSQTWPTGYVASYAYTAGGYLSKVTGGGVTGHTQTVSLEVLAMNPQGEVTQYKQGNNVTTIKTVDTSTGKLNAVQATLAGQTAGNVLNHAYGYDVLGNLKSRSDVNTGVGESFQYDALNRLSMYTAVGGGLSGTQVIQALYDAAGNLKYKSDVGYYHYDGARANRLTTILQAPGTGWSALGAVTQPNTGTRVLTYAFDDERVGAKKVPEGTGIPVGNGNLWYTVSQDSTNGRHTVRWETYTSFNMPRQILFGNLSSTTNPTSAVADRTLSFVYGPEHQRVRQDVQLTTNVPSHMQAGTTWYYNGADSQGLSYEKEVKANGTIEHRHYVNAAGIAFALYIKREGVLNGKPATSISYFHHDHLGSVAAISNELGQRTEQLAYDPWGKRRNINGTADKLDALYGVSTDRGYTLHEHLDEMGIIHMNGRIYDPFMARFMSADPHIQAPANLQSYNRYAYVLNNPLAYTDPSGYFSLKVAFRVVAAIAVATFAPQVFATYGLHVAGITAGQAAFINAVAAGALSGAIAADSSKGALQGAISAGLFHAAGLAGTGATEAEKAGSAGRYLAHAGAGCVSTVAGGGKCGQGAASAVFGKFTTNQIAGFGEKDLGSVIARGVATSVAGGVGSVIAGGKFANGAETAAYGYLFNQVAHAARAGAATAAGGVAAAGPSVGERIALAVDQAAAHVGDVLDYIFKSDSVVLARNMVQDTDLQREPGQHAHHIVAANDPRAAPGRAVLDAVKMDVNSAFNGIFLDPSQHARIHTNVYYNAVNAGLAGAMTYGDVALRLTAMRAAIQSGVFPR